MVLIPTRLFRESIEKIGTAVGVVAIVYAFINPVGIVVVAEVRYLTVSDVADVVYKCYRYYEGSIERGIAWNDPDVGIEWPAHVEVRTSERDDNAPRLADIADELPFVYEPPASPS